MIHKIQFLCAILLFVVSFSFSQTTQIPDTNFEQALIDLGLDNTLDGSIPTNNISSITNLEIENRNIGNLTGIEDFISLRSLDCSGNQLINFDISNNIQLEQLFCSNNQLTNINISNNTNLEILWCYNNLLTNIDVSNNTNLFSFRCNDNLLTNIDVSNNSILNTFICESNQVAQIDVSQNPELDIFSCSNNLLTELNLTQNLKLRQLECNFNMLTLLDVSQNKELNTLLCFNNALIELDTSKNTSLNILHCNDNQLTNLDLFNNINLSEIHCFNNNLRTLNFSENKDLIYLDCHNNNLCTLDLRQGNNTNITFMDAKLNPELACIFVDDVIYSNNNWVTYIEGISSFVSSESECNVLNPLTPQVDSLQDVIDISFSLPTLSNGNYYTGPQGSGIPLNAGDIITNTQTIYIYNSNGCFDNESSFDVIITNKKIFIPKFFTPNNDGKNDLWKIIDLENNVKSITIYNRYGKLVKFISPNSKGWDGTFNSMLLPNDSYWYSILLNDANILHGCFALKR
ncbi:hypothetical protein MHTCC0001_12890 [Flavobacteriaceae bacterium MHTCC 0001]